MKKLFTLIAILAINFTLFSQAPQKMSYQAVIRNDAGALVTNHAVGMKISILQGSASGTAVYVETHTTTTNANGLATIEIGGGSVVSGNFTGINWGSGTYYLKTETDPAGGSIYTIVGTSQLLSVPYALNSKISESVADNSITSAKIADGTIASADLGNNSVTSVKISDGTIATADLAANSITTDKINTGAVTKSKLSATGGSSGQVLKLSDGSLTWGNDNNEGLTLPYSGSASSSGSSDLFYISNLGTGRCIQAVAESNTAIWGRTTSGYAGVDGRSTSGYGISGHSESSYGVYGKGDMGVKGIGVSAGVSGEASGSTNAYGVIGEVSSSSGTSVYAVYGACSSTSGYSGFFTGGQFHISGKVGIGTTTPGCKLQVGVATDGTYARANQWDTFSDVRLKKGLMVINSPVEKVGKINGYYFYWNTGIDNARKIGFSAQELIEILPEVVTEGDDGYLSVDYGKITPLLVEAIKELKAENNELKERLEKIEKSIIPGLK